MRIGFYNFAFAAVAASVAVGVFADDAAGALRTVTEFFPLMTTWAGGRVRRIRREDGRVDEYGYSMEGGVWTEKVTHLHESADAHVEGRTTRDFTLTNGRGETVETRTEAYVGGEWRVVARELRTHDAQGRVVRRENLAGEATTTEWDCCHKTSETRPDGSTATWEYDEEDRMTASQTVPCRFHGARGIGGLRALHDYVREHARPDGPRGEKRIPRRDSRDRL